MVSRFQLRRHPKYGKNDYRDNRGRPVIARRQRLNPDGRQYVQRDEREDQVARHQHRSNQVRPREQNDRRCRYQQDQQHRFIAMRAPEPNAADNREQREQRERPTAKSVLEGLERLQCSRRLDPVVISPLHSLDAVSQSRHRKAAATASRQSALPPSATAPCFALRRRSARRQNTDR